MTDSVQTAAPVRAPAKPVLTPYAGSQGEYDALPADERAKWLKPDVAGKQSAFKAVHKALADALKRTDLTAQEHYDLNTPYQALSAHVKKERAIA